MWDVTAPAWAVAGSVRAVIDSAWDDATSMWDVATSVQAVAVATWTARPLCG